MCCMITSNQTNMRSIVIVVAYLMNKFRWALGKSLEYIRAKNVYIGLNDHYVEQLEILEEILNLDSEKHPLTKVWSGPYFSTQE